MFKNIFLTLLMVLVSGLSVEAQEHSGELPIPSGEEIVVQVQESATLPNVGEEPSQPFVDNILGKVDSVVKTAMHQFDKHKSFCEKLHSLVLVDSEHILELKQEINAIRKTLDDLSKGTASKQLKSKTSMRKPSQHIRAKKPKELSPKTVAALKKLREKRVAMRKKMKDAANGKITKAGKSS